MRQSLVYCALVLLCVGGAFVGQSMAEESAQVVAAPAQAAPAQAAPAQAAPAQQANMGYSRSNIRSMPLLSRPNRPGHFIGNTIRRRNAR